VVDVSDDASAWMNSQYNLYYVPTNYFDGGHSVVVGASSEANFRSKIQSAGSREVVPLDLDISLEWLGNATLGISVKLNQRLACVDSDGDGFGDPGYPENECPEDNCPTIYNPSQGDADGDQIGDACDECTDTDGDGLGDPGYPANTCPEDNCASVFNPDQDESDGDGVADSCDNCISVQNPDQGDYDNDGIGDICDVCTDFDNDGYGDPGFPVNTCELDNCPSVYNPSQDDADGDGVGDVCDICPNHENDDCCNPTEGNLPPELTSPATVELAAGDSLVYVATATDPNCDGTELSISIWGYPDWCQLSGDTLSGYVECGYQSESFGVTILDGELSDVNPISLNIEQNQAPNILDNFGTVLLKNGTEFSYYPTIDDPDDTEHIITYTSIPHWCSVQDDTVFGVAPDSVFEEDLEVTVEDFCGSDTYSFTVKTFVCGDADGSGNVDIDDAVFLINYVFAAGPEPDPYESGDADCSVGIDIDDIVYIIGFIFSGGNVPCDADGDSVPDC
jgi:hypothetical protein